MAAGRIAIVFVITLFLAASCAPPAPPASEDPALTLAVPNEPLAVLAFVALSEELFTAHGIEVRTVVVDCGARGLDACVAGEHDLVLAPDVPIALRSLEAAELHVLAVVGSADDDSRVIARRSSGIETASDLAGKRVGAVQLGQTHCYLGVLLESVGLDKDRIDIVFLDPNEGARALRAGELDALSVRPPLLAELEADLGADSVVLEATVAPQKSLMLVARPALVDERPDDIARVLSALLAAEKHMTDPAIAERAAASVMGPADTDWNSLLGSGEFSVHLDQSMILRLEHRARWLVSSGCVEGVSSATAIPNVLDIIDADALGAVDPSRVSILGWSGR